MVPEPPLFSGGVGPTQMTLPGPRPRRALSPASEAGRDKEPGGGMGSSERHWHGGRPDEGRRREALQGDEMTLT